MLPAVLWIVGAAVVACLLYSINRRHRWMVENGFAEETKPSGGGPFSVMRDFIEPSAENIRQINEQQQHRAEKEAPGKKADDDRLTVQ